MVEKELQSNQTVLTSVCQGLTVNFSEVCQAIKGITDTISTLQSTQMYVLENQDEIQKKQIKLSDCLKDLKDDISIFKCTTQERLDALEQRQIKNQKHNSKTY